MKKINVSSIEQTTNVEVIFLNSYLIAKIVRAFDAADGVVEHGKYQETKYNSETHEREPVLDEDGKPVIRYRDESTPVVEERIYPLLKELVEALDIEKPVV